MIYKSRFFDSIFLSNSDEVDFKYPGGCQKEVCDVHMSWKEVANGYLEFVVTVPQLKEEAKIHVGFSKEGKNLV